MELGIMKILKSPSLTDTKKIILILGGSLFGPILNFTFFVTVARFVDYRVFGISVTDFGLASSVSLGVLLLSFLPITSVQKIVWGILYIIIFTKFLFLYELIAVGFLFGLYL